MEAQRVSLQQAEMLFDLELTDYSEYLRCKTEFAQMEQIYKVYKAQKYARELWGKTLWVNLNTQVLIDGIEVYLKDFRKLPKVCRTMPVGVALDSNMKAFKNTIPLMVALRNEAMRDRHWKELMNKTGITFDMAPDRFTLDNMFSMELHR